MAYTSAAVLAWERRHLYAGGWVCLGRRDELLVDGTTQRGCVLGDVPALLTASADGPRLFANTCRHRGHELVPDGGSSARPAVTCPYHGWAYDLSGALLAAPGYPPELSREQHGLVELPLEEWGGFLFGHGLDPLGSPDVVPLADQLGAVADLLAPYRLAELRVGARHGYEVAANWKVVAENYHECYHCPEIHPELCAVSPPTSGDNYDLPGWWVGGRMDLRPGTVTMSLTGESGGRPIEGAPQRTVEYLHVLPSLLVSAHPDYVMTHRLLPLEPGRTWIECTWLFPPASDGTLPDPAYAVDFWDLTNRQDWAACESVQRGLVSPHFRPGPFSPREDAVARFVGLVATAYETGDAPLRPA
ncbi:aromatic ring-hydroxylating oxygenase subunit alpha [Nocardioides coralli]|uniref:aromatic ring-hydroxylating oxygenase subunit alpha n=1 Tax=Nocardioides coralli TaxID=2872154 RepID=UPI001CA3F65B|nr:SRPBCC family protein [Nocardioides coralli]QZY29881.1 Rieske 2Fe-2S domain-containing protein [Nocardioides coralli]